MHFKYPHFLSSTTALTALALLHVTCGLSTAMDATLTLNTENVVQTANPHRLTGTNLSLWSRAPIIENPAFKEAIRNWKPFSIRMPGGSWSNEYYWNGNGVRTGNGHGEANFDTSKQREDGIWEIDYSDYKKGFRLHGEARHLSDYHGDLDVKTQHEWINEQGSEAMVTVNVGSGTPKLATEWVRWANIKNKYDVRYWEVGNELNGDWELGHRLADGTSMTGTVYAQKFVEFAQAMSSVDPSIKLGGPACSDLALDFVEELIRDGGDALDFVSIHAYPVGVNTQDSASKFAAIDDLRKAIHKVDDWIKQYQPERADQIEIGITEWNIKVNEDRDTADLISALWSSIWIGALFETGVDFANQWDLTTYTTEGGHSAFHIDETNMSVMPKSQYWALWMWSNLMGTELIEGQLTGASNIKSFVTRTENGLQLMLINTSETEDARITVKLENNKRLYKKGTQHTFSRAEYFWDPHARRPLWSDAPSQKTLHFDKSRLIHIPKFSVNVVHLTYDEQAAPNKVNRDARSSSGLRLLLPERVAADRRIEAWVVRHTSHNESIELAISGPATLSESSVTLDHGSARFYIQPTGAGNLTVSAQSTSDQIEKSIELVALKERKHVHWTFDNPINEWDVKSTFEIGSESSIKPNQFVAASRLTGQTPASNKDLLFHFEPMPRETLPLNTASGIIGQLRAAHDLQCEDPKARVNVILQSDANHWMPIASIPLSQIIGEWKSFEATVTSPEQLDAMGKLYAIRLQIQSDAPITGDIYLDDLGFIFRTGL